MANPYGLPEVSLNQLGDSTHAVNTVGFAANNRSEVLKAHTVIVTNHDDSGDLAAGNWPDGTATTKDAVAEQYLIDNAVIFVSKAHGHPWTRGSLKDVGLEHIIHKAAATPSVPTDTTVLYPNHDYGTFE